MSETNERSVASTGSVLYAIVEHLRSLAGVPLNEREGKLVILLNGAMHEIDRLRLTEEERALLSRLGSDTREWDKYSNGRPWFVRVEDAAIIRGILERLD